MKNPNEEIAAGIAEYFEGDCSCENARKCKSCDLKEHIQEKLDQLSASKDAEWLAKIKASGYESALLAKENEIVSLKEENENKEYDIASLKDDIQYQKDLLSDEQHNSEKHIKSHNVNKYLCSGDRGKFLAGKCIVCAVEQRFKKENSDLVETVRVMRDGFIEISEHSKNGYISKESAEWSVADCIEKAQEILQTLPLPKSSEIAEKDK